MQMVASQQLRTLFLTHECTQRLLHEFVDYRLVAYHESSVKYFLKWNRTFFAIHTSHFINSCYLSHLTAHFLDNLSLYRSFRL